VLLFSLGAFDAVINGDATQATESTILGRYTNDWLDVELLKIGHHGSSTTSTSQAWVDALRPELAVASASGTQYGHPRRTVIERLFPYTDNVEQHQIQWGFRAPAGGYSYPQINTAEGVFTTSTNGNIVIRSNGSWYEAQWQN